MGKVFIKFLIIGCALAALTIFGYKAGTPNIAFLLLDIAFNGAKAIIQAIIRTFNTIL